MEKLTNINDDPIQSFVLIVGKEQANIQLRFYPTIQSWYFNLEFRGIQINGIKISLGVLHIKSYNFPFDFVAEDTSGLGIDPFKVDDFQLGRINLYMLNAVEMAAIRGYSVKV